jgi:simple sugar transport system ATP-binding protein
VLDLHRIQERATKLIADFDIRPADSSQVVHGLSGGNQQKLVIARELSRNGAKLLICAQPTRGVDIGAIEAIHRRMLEARASGLAVLLVSADLSELRALSDRMVVMFKGRLVASFSDVELAADDALEQCGKYMTGVAVAPGQPKSEHGGEQAAPRTPAGAESLAEERP